jgi:hypothetical protein
MAWIVMGSGAGLLDSAPAGDEHVLWRALKTEGVKPGQIAGLRAEPEPLIPTVPRGLSFLAPLDGVTNQPESRSPQTNEQSATLRIPSLILVDRLRADPKTNAQSD